VYLSSGHNVRESTSAFLMIVVGELVVDHG